MRWLIINAVYWGLGLEDAISPNRSVDVVGVYQPLESGFDYKELGVIAKRPAAYR